MLVVNGGIEQRPWLGACQQRGHRSGHEIAIESVVRGRIVDSAFRHGHVDAPQGQDDFLERGARKAALLFSARDAGVLAIGIALGQLAQFKADGVDRERDDVLVACRNRAGQHAGKIVDLLQRCAGAITLIGQCAVADRGEIGDEIFPVLRLQPKIEDLVEIGHDLIEGIEPSVMEIWRVEIGIAQRGRLEKTARADIMLLVIDEAAGRNMAARTAHAGIVRKWLCEQRFTPAFGFADPADQPAAGTEA